jgi:hypothetical protein
MAGSNDLVADRIAGQEDSRGFGTIELTHHIVMLFQDLDRVRKGENCVTVCRVQLLPILQFAEHRLQR